MNIKDNLQVTSESEKMNTKVILQIMLKDLNKMTIKQHIKIIKLCEEICDIKLKFDELISGIQSDPFRVKDIAESALKRMLNDADKLDSYKMNQISLLYSDIDLALKVKSKLKIMLEKFDQMSTDEYNEIIKVYHEVLNSIFKLDVFKPEALLDESVISVLAENALNRMQNDFDEFDSDKMKSILDLSKKIESKFKSK